MPIVRKQDFEPDLKKEFKKALADIRDLQEALDLVPGGREALQEVARRKAAQEHRDQVFAQTYAAQQPPHFAQLCPYYTSFPTIQVQQRHVILQEPAVVQPHLTTGHQVGYR